MVRASARRFPSWHGPLRITIAAVAVLLAAVLGSSAAIAQEQGAPGPGATPGVDSQLYLPGPPMVTIQAIPPYGPAPLMVGFLLNAIDPENRGFVSFVWNFGDGHVSTEPPLVFTYNTYKKPGSYVVTVTVTTSDGRSTTGFTGVIVKPSVGAGAQQPLR